MAAPIRLRPEQSDLGPCLPRDQLSQVGLWTVPIIAIVLVELLAPMLRGLDSWLHWRLVGFEPSGAQSLYQTVITLTLSFLVFRFGSLLVAIQVAGGQLTPRIIAATLLRDNGVRYSVGLSVFTLVFAVTGLDRQGASVDEVGVFLTGILGIACIADFLFLIDYTARLLRPVSVLTRIGDEGVVMIKSVYPEPAAALTPEAAAPLGPPPPPSGRSSTLARRRSCSPSTWRHWWPWPGSTTP